MVLENVGEIEKTARDVYELYKRELERVERIDSYLRGKHDKPYTPSTVTEEYKLLQKRSIANWLALIVDVMAQVLWVEGYRPSDSSENTAVWDLLWQPNDMDARQGSLHRAALSYGLAYTIVLPGDPVPVIRAASPRRAIAVFEDPVDDEWPSYALTVRPMKGGKESWRLFDEQNVYELEGEKGGDSATFVDVKTHEVGVCPVVRFADNMDLDGRACGEVEPLIPLQDQINQTTFDLLIAQTYGSFKVRTVTGMSVTLGADGKPVDAIELSAKRLLVTANKDAKFDTLDETDLGGYLKSREQAVQHLAAISQTPPHHLLGQMANLSAEALVAAESGRERKSDGQRHGLGESHEKTLRLGARIGGIEGADDESAQVVWKGSEARSLASTADALGKLATQLGVPPQALWEMIPGVTQTTVERWKALAQENDALGRLMADLERDATQLESTV